MHNLVAHTNNYQLQPLVRWRDSSVQVELAGIPQLKRSDSNLSIVRDD